MENTDTTTLIELLRRGGVFYNINGNTPQEVLADFFAQLSVFPSLDKKRLLDAVLEREALMPTAIGQGIALPHPRNPLVSEPADQFVAIAFLNQEVNWKALDNKAVHTAILIVSASAKLHLHALSWINFFCRQDSFRELLQHRAPKEKICETIEEIEKNWNN